MSLTNFTCVGPGEVLAFLRSDLRSATKSLFVIGPWMDDYFAEQVIACAAPHLAARVLIRPEHQIDPLAWPKTLAALALFRWRWAKFQVRQLAHLHAKCVCIDGQTVYIGSANWYRYSLENAIEIVLRGSVDSLDGGDAELESLWDRGEPLQLAAETKPKNHASPPAEGIPYEVLDPIAAKVLRENPKAFVIGTKPRRRHN